MRKFEAGTRPGGPQAPPAESFRLPGHSSVNLRRDLAVKGVFLVNFSRFRPFRLERQPENSVLPVWTRRMDVSSGIFGRKIVFQGKFSRFSDPMDISRARNEVFGHRRCPKPTGMTSTNYFRL